MWRGRIYAIFAAALLAASPAWADLITNGSFETASGISKDSNLTPSSNSTALTGWTVTANDIAWVKSGDYGLISEDGSYLIDLTGIPDNTPQGTIAQTVTLTPGKSYLLSFWVGSDYTNLTYYSQNKEVSVAITGLAAQDFTTDFSSGSTGNVWEQFTYQFTASASSTTISFEGISATVGDPQGNIRGYQYLGLDNVSLNLSVPLPTSIWEGSLLLGSVFVASKFRRLRQGI